MHLPPSNMRFVPTQSGGQQAGLALHRARQGVVKARTAQANQIRGLLAEYGIVIAQGIGHIARRLPEILEDGETGQTVAGKARRSQSTVKCVLLIGASASKFHQGQRLEPQSKSGSMAAISTFSRQRLMAWQTGGDHL